MKKLLISSFLLFMGSTLFAQNFKIGSNGFGAINTFEKDVPKPFVTPLSKRLIFIVGGFVEYGPPTWKNWSLGMELNAQMGVATHPHYILLTMPLSVKYSALPWLYFKGGPTLSTTIAPYYKGIGGHCAVGINVYDYWMCELRYEASFIQDGNNYSMIGLATYFNILPLFTNFKR